MRLTLDTPSVMTRAIATRRPVLIADPEELRAQFASDPDADGDAGRVLDTGDEQAWVGLPLLAAGMPLGALRFSFGKPRTILEEERVFLEALAGQCALAVERAEMYEKEHTAAVTLQRSLLPGRAAERAAASRSTPGTCRGPPTWAVTGTTCSGCPTGGWPSRSATSWARGCSPRPAWAGCATRCARSR